MAIKELVSPIVERAWGSPFLSLSLFCTFVCLSTRLLTGIRYARVPGKQGLTRAGVLPYWLPYIGHFPNFALDFEGILQKGRDSTKDGMFSLVMAGKKHQFVAIPSMVKTFFTKGNAIISSDEFLYWIHEKYFDDNGSTRRIPKDVFLNNIHRALGSLIREPYLSNITDKTRKGCEDRTQDLVSLPFGKNEGTVWTAAARSSAIGSNNIEAVLWPLIMNFVGDIVASALMGQAFVENYPQLLEDLWIFDVAFSKLLSGMPGVTSGIRNAKAARRRLKSNIREWTEAIIATQDGKDAGFKWSELSDVSETMKIRTRKYYESGAPADAYLAGNLAIFWGLMVNSNKVIFWMLLNIVANEDL
jgi:hypothetical protein